nr:MAG TPA: hypothetical protein [Caudoviricetes sp.]
MVHNYPPPTCDLYNYLHLGSQHLSSLTKIADLSRFQSGC